MTTNTTPSNPSYVGTRIDLLALMSNDCRRALDIGCAEGALGSALKTRNPGTEVTGIELDPSMASHATKHLDRVLTIDAMTALKSLVAEGQQYDVVICGDVLEHLEDPWSALRQIRQLCPIGQVVVSLPNIGHWTTWWNVIARGYWPYRDRGIHDRTHLRFFARNNLAELFRSAGFQITELQTSHRLFESPSRWSRLLGRCVGWIPLLGRMTTYQFLCVLR